MICATVNWLSLSFCNFNKARLKNAPYFQSNSFSFYNINYVNNYILVSLEGNCLGIGRHHNLPSLQPSYIFLFVVSSLMLLLLWNWKKVRFISNCCQGKVYGINSDSTGITWQSAMQIKLIQKCHVVLFCIKPIITVSEGNTRK